MKIKRTASALIAALCLLLCACTGRAAAKKESIALWYVEGAAGAEQLCRLIDEYNSLGEAAVSIGVRGFADEASLAAAFDTARPELLLCSHPRAVSLGEQGLLKKAAGQDVEYAEFIKSRFDWLEGFYPIGLDTQLLYYAESCFENGVPDSLEALMATAAEYSGQWGLPFFTADSFGDIIYTAMLQNGEQLHGEREQDIFSDTYKSIYNMLAGAACEGALVCSEISGRRLVEGGCLPCAAVRSSSLAGLKGANAAPLPTAGDGGQCLADCIGLAVTARDDRGAARAGGFISWLAQGNRLCTLAINSGLVPAAANAAPERAGGLVRALMSLYDAGDIHLPDMSVDYMKNREQTERELRLAFSVFR